MGNESCDLDSTVSSLIYSFLLAQHPLENTIILPVLNMMERDFPIKTEVNYFCKKCGIKTNNFIFRDQINLVSVKEAGVLELMLVDHHTLTPEDDALRSAVVEVIDHRPLDPGARWPAETQVCVESVGSCSTLIANKVLATCPFLITPNIAKLLYGTIVLDTACLSAIAGIARPLDFEITDKLQQICKNSLSSEEIFKYISTAKADISHLTPRQVLMKDLKIVSNVPIIGLPILVKDFLKIPESPASVEQFCDERRFKFAMLMGLNLLTGQIERDVALYWNTPDKENLSTKLLNKLQDSGFDLVKVSMPGLGKNFTVFKQNNVKHSRKKMLPIIRDFSLTM